MSMRPPTVCGHDHGSAHERIGTAQAGWIGTSGDGAFQGGSEVGARLHRALHRTRRARRRFQVGGGAVRRHRQPRVNRNRQCRIESGLLGAVTRGDNAGRRSGLATRADRRGVPGGGTACPHQRSGGRNSAKPVGLRDVEGRSRRGRATGHQSIGHHAVPVAEGSHPRIAGGGASRRRCPHGQERPAEPFSITRPRRRTSRSTWPPIR